MPSSYEENMLSKNSSKFVGAIFTLAPLLLFFIILASVTMIEKYGFHMFFYMLIMLFVIKQTKLI